jgi:hypothetical protein
MTQRLASFPPTNTVSQKKAAKTHDYVLMGVDLLTDEEYAGMG